MQNVLDELLLHCRDRVTRHLGDARQCIGFVERDPHLVHVALEAFGFRQIGRRAIGQIQDRDRRARKLASQVDLKLAVALRRSRYEEGFSQSPYGKMKIAIGPWDFLRRTYEGLRRAVARVNAGLQI